MDYLKYIKQKWIFSMLIPYKCSLYFTKITSQAHPHATSEHWFQHDADSANYSVTWALPLFWPSPYEWTEEEPVAFSRGLGLSGLRMWREMDREEKDRETEREKKKKGSQRRNRDTRERDRGEKRRHKERGKHERERQWKWVRMTDRQRIRHRQRVKALATEGPGEKANR